MRVIDIIKQTLCMVLLCGSLMASGGGGGTTMEPVPAPKPAPALSPAPTEPPATVTAAGIVINSSTLHAAISQLQSSSDLQKVNVDGVEFGIVASPLTTGFSNAKAMEPGAGDLKLIILPTSVDQMPTNGSALYDGKAEVVVTDGIASHHVTMLVTTTVRFGPAGGVDVKATTVAPGGIVIGAAGAALYDPFGSEAIQFTGLGLTGSVFSERSGSRASVTGFSGRGELLDANADLSAAGSIAGSSASELAGAASARGADGAEVLFVFTGKK